MADQFKNAFDHSPVAILIMDPSGSIVQVNATFESWTGYRQTDLIGKKIHTLLSVGARILYETIVLPLLNVNGHFSEIALELRTSTNETLAVFGHGKLYEAGDDHRAIFQLVLTEAKDRRRYERELVAARAAAKNSEAATKALLDNERETAHLREQFIAILGHDLRNPLAAIGSGLRLLQKEQSPEKQSFFYAMLTGSVIRMGALIDNVLDFARGRLGSGIPLDLRADVALEPLLIQVVSELKIGHPNQIIETKFDLPHPVKCDASRIGQLVSNLVGNALTHGRLGMPVRVDANSTATELTISVANAGQPISDAAMARLFQPFFRGEVKSSLQGLGLGLHIASEIAKAHGGTLTVQSSTDETRFTFEMPISKARSGSIF